jgi:hypothetical protein
MPRHTYFARLNDDTSIWIRHLRSNDKTCLKTEFKNMSERSRYFRFMSYRKTLSPSLLKHLTEIDNINHVALCAGTLCVEGRKGVGIARYIRFKDDPTVAEAAITVVDAYQRCGAGSILLQVLSQIAWNNGIRTFQGYILPENQKMINFVRRYQAQIQLEEGPLYRVNLDIPIIFENNYQTDILRLNTPYRKGVIGTKSIFTPDSFPMEQT